MLVVIQYPLADLSRFLETSVAKVSRPSWPHPIPYKEFIHFVGPIEPRKKGAIPEASSDGIFCRANRAFRMRQLEISISANMLDYFPSGRLRPQVAFRRLFTEGRELARLEVGLSFPREPNLLNAKAFDYFLKCILDLPVSISRGDSGIESTIGSAGEKLADLFRESTSSSAEVEGMTDFIISQSPLIFLQFQQKSVVNVPSKLFAKRVELSFSRGSKGLKTTVWRTERRFYNDLFQIWIASNRQDSLVRKNEIRNIRLCLFRLHGQIEALKAVLSAVERGIISFDTYSESCRRLKDYLEKVHSLLDRKSGAYGVDDEPIKDSLIHANDFFAELKTKVILENLRVVKGEVVNKLDILTKEKYAKMNKINNTTVTINGGTFYGPVTIADTIKDSFNRIEKIDEAEDIKIHLEQLHREVMDIVEKSDDEELSKGALDDLNRLVEEVQKSEAKRKWYEVSEEGLIEAAQAVGKVIKELTNPLNEIKKIVFGV